MASLTSPRPLEGGYPLSSLQQGMLYHHLASQERGVDVVQLVVTLHKKVDESRLKQAWETAASRYEVLRTAFRWEGCAEPEQVVHARVDLPWREYDWAHVAEAERKSHLASFLKEDREREIQMDCAPMWRLALIKWQSDEFSLVWTFHHAVLDGRSFLTVVGEAFALYDASKRDEVLSLPEPSRYSDYLQWLAGQDFSLSENFWRSLLEGVSAPTPLPVDAACDSGQDFGASKSDLAIELSDELTAKLRGFTVANGVTLNTLMQGAWALLLSRHSGEEDVVFGATRACRKSSVEGAESMVGLFINTLPVRARVRPDAPVVPWLQDLRKQWMEMRQHEHSPLTKVQGWSDVPRNTPLFESMVVFEKFSPIEALRSQGSEWLEREMSLFEKTNFPLTLSVHDGENLHLQIGYRTDRYSDGGAARLMGHLQALLESMCEASAKRLGDLQMLTAAERNQVLIEWNRTGKDYPGKRCIHELVELQAKRTPQNTAVTFEGSSCTYAELNAKANGVAQMLQGMGVGRGHFVPLLFGAGIDLIIAELGVMKAGAAFVPLDPQWPESRIESVLKDLSPMVMLADRAARVEVENDSARVMRISREEVTGSETNPASGAQLMDPIYLLFTSGSTGKPKGAINHHAGIVNRFFNMNDRFGCGENDVILATTGHVFDSSVWQYFWPLTRGGRTIIPSSRASSDPQYLLDLMMAERVTVTDFVPALLAAVTDQMDDDPNLATRLGCLRHILVGGEAINPGVTYRFKAHLPGAGVTNAYGPTETSIGVIFYELPKEPVDSLPIGKPLHNVYALILDQNLNPLPSGVPGDLYIGGICVGLGYLNNEQATRQAFIPNPFPELDTPTLYRTGDRAKFLPDGNIAFLGRNDAQVKVRGFRIELGDIESALRDCRGVRDCVVLAREDVPGEKRLVAYLLPMGGQPIPGRAELRESLKRKLPAYMIPAAFVTLENFPQTPSGKVDRKALPPPPASRSECDEDYVAPRTPIEEAMAAVWKKVLKVDSVGIHDNFFELGGHSLLAMRVTSQIRGTLGLDLSLRDLFERPTVAGLAAGLAGNEEAGAPPLAPVPRAEPPELSFGQERLWLIDQMAPEGAPYIIPLAFFLDGKLDTAALERSVQSIVARHEALRTHFHLRDDGQPVQVIAPESGVALSTVDLSALTGGEQESALQREITASSRAKFDLASGPLFQCTLLRLTPTRHLFLFTVHHAVFDDWSLNVFRKELSFFYTAFLKGETANLPALPIQYADYAVWQRRWLQGSVLENQLGYWRKQLEGAPELLEMPTDRPRPAVNSYRGATMDRVLPKSLATKLKELSRVEGASLFMITLAALQALLHRYTGAEDIAVGSVIADRNRTELESLIGFLVNTLVVRGDLSGDPTFQTLLRRTREVTLAAFAHQDLPFEKLVEALRPRRDSSYSPLFQVMFQLETAPAETARLPGLETRCEVTSSNTAKFDLTFLIRDAADSLKVEVEYNTDLFDAATISRMLGHYKTLLEAVAANPEQKISQLPLLTTPERQQLVIDWNRTQTDDAKARYVHDLVSEQAAKTPDVVAVVFGDKRLTYRELDARTNQLARYLRKCGVGVDTLVGVCVERSLEMVIALLGVLKAGGAYVPLDPRYPKDRVAFVLKDAAAGVLLTQTSFAGDMPASAKAIRLDADWAVIAAESDAPLESTTKGSDLAYVIYTSGSTGLPKGVEIPHEALVNFLHSMQKTPGLTARDVLVAVTTISFDIAGLEIFLPLITGAKLVVLSREDAADGSRLLDNLISHDATVLQATPTTWRLLLDEPWPGSPKLKMLCGGEAMPRDLAEQLLAKGAELWNMYGPTETTIWSTVARVTPGQPAIHIGRPIANTDIFILDPQLNPTPIGVPGELHIGGTGLARGYHTREKLTAEKFIKHPFSNDPQARLYKTGDLARYLPDGNIEHLGRLDHQVKLRGFRIEPGEIEEVLNQHPGVQTSAVVAREDFPGDKRLVAYLVNANGALRLSELRDHLRAKLPDYMVPAAFVALEALPLTPNGKVDRKALPKPEFEAVTDRSQFVAPGTETEIALAKIWCEVLHLEQVGLDDNFFDIGGHSILAVRLINKIRTVMNFAVPIPVFFQNPTIRELAAVCDRANGANAATDSRVEKEVFPRLITFQSKGTLPPLFFLHSDWAGRGLYCGQISRMLGPEQPFHALPPYCSGRKEILSMREMVDHHLAVVREHTPRGPYVLGGYCVGATVAIEMARRLTAEGEDIRHLLLVDPAYRDAPSLRWIWRATDAAGDVLKWVLLKKIHFYDRYGAALVRWFRSRPPGKLHALARRLGLRNGSESLPDATGLNAGDGEVDVLQGLDYGVYFLASCLHTIEPLAAPIPLTVYFPEGTWPSRWRVKQAREISPNVTVEMVPGNHHTCIVEHSSALVDKMRQTLGG